MRIVNVEARRMFSSVGPCEICLMPCRRQTAHVFSVGAGQVDHPINLIGIGGAPCFCHARSHAGHGPNRRDLLRIVAAREGWSVESIVDAIHATRRAPKECPHVEGPGGVLCGHEKPVRTVEAGWVTRPTVTPYPCPLCWALWLRSESARPLAF